MQRTEVPVCGLAEVRAQPPKAEHAGAPIIRRAEIDHPRAGNGRAWTVGGGRPNRQAGTTTPVRVGNELE